MFIPSILQRHLYYAKNVTVEIWEGSAFSFGAYLEIAMHYKWVWTVINQYSQKKRCKSGHWGSNLSKGIYFVPYLPLTGAYWYLKSTQMVLGIVRKANFLVFEYLPSEIWFAVNRIFIWSKWLSWDSEWGLMINNLDKNKSYVRDLIIFPFRYTAVLFHCKEHYW